MDKKNDFLFPDNATFLEKLYFLYIEDPSKVDKSFRRYFDNMRTSTTPNKSVDGIGKTQIYQANESTVTHSDKLQPGITTSADEILLLKAEYMISHYRERGHLLAQLDPLDLEKTPNKKDLKLRYVDFGFKESDLELVVELTKPICGIRLYTIHDLISALDTLYSGSIGSEFDHVENFAEREWLYEHVENINILSDITDDKKKSLLTELIKVKDFEYYLHTKFPGAKRFSIEGGEASILSLKEIITFFSYSGTEEIHIGMAHRGRLSTLTSVMQKPYHAIFAEFIEQNIDSAHKVAGDVKYHMGYSSKYIVDDNHTTHLSLAFNPSHLEAVNPVLSGRVKAKQDVLGDTECQKVMGILIHGDAAFCGQGVVAESLAMRGLAGYDVGGIVHIVINNQIGFTANSWDCHAGRYATEFAKIADAPIIHVNGDDIEAVTMATILACRYKQRYKKDIVIDIVCYRQYGHNEGDEPMFTHSVMYNVIRAKESTGMLYAQKLIANNVLSEAEFNEIQHHFKAFLDSEYELAKSHTHRIQAFEGKWEGYHRFDTRMIETGISKELFKKIIDKICAYPKDFDVHPKIAKLLEKRRILPEAGYVIDWATAEQLAFASILLEEIPIRLSGEDSGRATFGYRNAVLHSQTSNNRFIPLNHLSKSQGGFTVIDSLLSEYAVLGFEYGYSLVDPQRLVIWEAQYGDFANTAQVIIDQFISSGETKWLRMSGLVLLLPHGYDGQGPEHSSARIERYLQLAGHDNMVIVNPSNPASYFHILRRQVHTKAKKPLIIFTPKYMLRAKEFVSSFADITNGTSFSTIIDDTIKKDKVKRVIFCSGKIYYDLIDKRTLDKINHIALIRIEQLYPFPSKMLEEIIKSYKGVKEFVWCQEEHSNMGAWNFVRPIIEEIISKLCKNKELIYIGRDEAASPATGAANLHHLEKKQYMNKALTIRK